MPHIHLQTSDNLSENERIKLVLADLVGLLSTFETIEPKAIKGYQTLRTTWVMGEGAPAGFIHCEVALLTGRSTPLRTEIGIAFERKLQELFASSIGIGLAKVTVEVREMDSETYRR